MLNPCQMLPDKEKQTCWIRRIIPSCNFCWSQTNPSSLESVRVCSILVSNLEQVRSIRMQIRNMCQIALCVSELFCTSKERLPDIGWCTALLRFHEYELLGLFCHKRGWAMCVFVLVPRLVVHRSSQLKGSALEVWSVNVPLKPCSEVKIHFYQDKRNAH